MSPTPGGVVLQALKRPRGGPDQEDWCVEPHEDGEKRAATRPMDLPLTNERRAGVEGPDEAVDVLLAFCTDGQQAGSGGQSRVLRCRLVLCCVRLVGLLLGPWLVTPGIFVR